MPFTRALTKSLKFGRHGSIYPYVDIMIRIYISLVPLDVYLNTYISVVIVDLSITIILHNTPLYSTYKASRRLIERR
jgi:hypothetical protein